MFWQRYIAPASGCGCVHCVVTGRPAQSGPATATTKSRKFPTHTTLIINKQVRSYDICTLALHASQDISTKRKVKEIFNEKVTYFLRTFLFRYSEKKN